MHLVRGVRNFNIFATCGKNCKKKNKLDFNVEMKKRRLRININDLNIFDTARFCKNQKLVYKIVFEYVNEHKVYAK